MKNSMDPEETLYLTFNRNLYRISGARVSYEDIPSGSELFSGMSGTIDSGLYKGNMELDGGHIQSANFKTSSTGWKVDSDGSAEFNDLYVTGFVKTVSVGGDIQAAIDILNAAGGGEIRLDAGTHTLTTDIVIYNNVHLVGSGRDSTILEFSGLAKGITVTGTSSVSVVNWSIKNLTLQNSNSTAGILIDYCDYWTMENVRVTSCDQKGIRVRYSENFSVANCRFDSNTGNGVELIGDSSGASVQSSGYLFYLCLSDDNGAHGFSTDVDTNDFVPSGSFFECRAEDNTTVGFSTVGSGDESFISCTSSSNTGDGFSCSAGNKSYTNCLSSQNSGDGYDVSGGTVKFSSCRSVSDSGQAFNISATSGFSMTGCSHPATLGNDLKGSVAASSPTADNVLGGPTSGFKSHQIVYGMENGSGGTISAGMVVVFKADSDGDVVTTTTTVGDDKVVGVAMVSMTDGRPASVMVQGKTTLLKVNGTTDIAIGDFLSTYSEAGIAAKASAGDMVFAIALEAYTTNDSAGVIDALIISPRLI